ncbi:hypothetical protein INT44_000690 [Umbelopsis vinacea]|uniref:Zn(2)-C6 fungal-type domain-containing protein n=1 Tax=Umbelopsis vinacea TaxID=44442 RepID=A0A8H7ULT9_9FUNG|nr:hypothetical protein INT44_000690 [Umbelopsis vinacea]
MDYIDLEDSAYVKEEEEEEEDQKNSSKPVRRRARLALSCQRCRKNRSKCSRTRPKCLQCEEADTECTYLEIPGDLESTALRQRFAGLEDQIHTALAQFDAIENLVKDNLDCVSQQQNANIHAITNGQNGHHDMEVDLPVDEVQINTRSIQSWDIERNPEADNGGLSIHTYSRKLDDLCQVLLSFGLDNMHLTGQEDRDAVSYEPKNLIRNDVIYRSMRLSHFTTVSLKHIPNDVTMAPKMLMENDDSDGPISLPRLPPQLLVNILHQHHNCILHGSIPKFARTFSRILLQNNQPQQLKMLQSSMLCHLIPHAFRWHPSVLMPYISSERESFNYAQKYYLYTRQILAACCFEEPTLLTVHSLVNLALYNIESGDPNVTYMNIGMASRMVYSLGMHREENLLGLVESQLETTPILRSVFTDQNDTVQSLIDYARSLFWVVYCIDTDASHFHNKPYNMTLDDCTVKFHTPSNEATLRTKLLAKREKSMSPPTRTYDLFPPLSQGYDEDDEPDVQVEEVPNGLSDPYAEKDRYQALYKRYNFENLQITREIRETCYSDSQVMVSLKEVERIEGILHSFYAELPEWIRNEDEVTPKMSLWQSRCKYMELIRYYGNWILLHQTYLPLPELSTSPAPASPGSVQHSPPSRFAAFGPLDEEHNRSLEACTKAAMRISKLFDMWVPASDEMVAVGVDCYFRPCVHEFKHACEVLVYNAHHAQMQPVKDQALSCLKQLMEVMRRTPVWDIAKDRPFMMTVQQTIAEYE